MTVEKPPPQVKAVGRAIRGASLAFTGEKIPLDVHVTFEGREGKVSIVPDVVRPHWVFLANLPDSVAPGETRVDVISERGRFRATTSVTVSTDEPDPVRILHAGRDCPSPFTIAFVGTAGIMTPGGQMGADKLAADRVAFQATVTITLKKLLTLEESLFRDGGLERLIRFVTVFVPRQPVSDETTLVQEYGCCGIMTPRRRVAMEYLRRHGVDADVVFATHGSTSHTQPSCEFTIDDWDRECSEYFYDGSRYVHGHFAELPGACALPIHGNASRPVALHEFAHAVSESRSPIIDAYVESGPPGFIVNKKYRPRANDSVPVEFGFYNGTHYTADSRRDSLGYPSDWRSYHPDPIDGRRPNLMDDYTKTHDDPDRCRFDRLTYQWLRDRLWTKATR